MATLLMLSGMPGKLHAQVEINQDALGQLTAPPEPAAKAADTPTASKKAKPPARPHSAPQKAATQKNVAKKAGAPAAAAAPAAPLPTIRAAPPNVAEVPPPEIPPPLHPLPPPPPVPVLADAVGAVSALPQGVRISFAPGSAALNPKTHAALLDLAHRAVGQPNDAVTVLAYATGTPDDPSTTRRLALSRGLAARAVLILAGMPSTRVYVRAMGDSSPPEGMPEAQGSPGDRADLVLAPNGSAMPSGSMAPPGNVAPPSSVAPSSTAANDPHAKAIPPMSAPSPMSAPKP